MLCCFGQICLSRLITSSDHLFEMGRKIGSGNQRGEVVVLKKFVDVENRVQASEQRRVTGGRWTDKQSGGSAVWRLDGLTVESAMMKQLLQPWGTKWPWQAVERRRSTCAWAGNAEAEGKLLLPQRTRVKAARRKFCVLNLGKFMALSKKERKKPSKICCRYAAANQPIKPKIWL